MSRWRPCLIACLCLLSELAVAATDLSQGQAAVSTTTWDAMTVDEKKLFVLNAATDCHRAGYDGRVTVWSDGGERVLATYVPGDRVKILRGWQSQPTTGGYLSQIRPGNDSNAAIGLVLIAFGAILALVVFLIQVVALRWIFRVNVIVVRQEEIRDQLGRIAGLLEAVERPPTDPTAEPTATATANDRQILDAYEGKRRSESTR